MGYLIGKRMLLNLIKAFRGLLVWTLLVLSLSVYAEEKAHEYQEPLTEDEVSGTLQIMGTVRDDQTDYFQPLTEKEAGENVFVPNRQFKQETYSEKVENQFVPGTFEEGEARVIKNKDGTLSKSQLPVAGAFENSQVFFDYSNYETVKNASKYRKGFFSISFFKDTFTYEDNDNLFNETFRRDGNGKSSEFPFFIRVTNVAYVSKSLVDIGLGMALGFGYNAGKGVFVDNQAQSDARFKLWTLPLDVVFAIEIPLSRYFKATGQAGPSLLGLIQNRSDKQEDSRDRNIRQFSPGWFLGAQFKISLSDMIRRLGYKLFTEMDISKMHLMFDARVQQYSSFKSKDLKVSGNSIGFGFSFEYF